MDSGEIYKGFSFLSWALQAVAFVDPLMFKVDKGLSNIKNRMAEDLFYVSLFTQQGEKINGKKTIKRNLRTL